MNEPSNGKGPLSDGSAVSGDLDDTSSLSSCSASEKSDITIMVDLNDDTLENNNSYPCLNLPNSSNNGAEEPQPRNTQDNVNKNIDPITIPKISNATLNLAYPYSNQIPNEAKKLHLTCTEQNTKLTNLNPIHLTKSINELSGTVEKIKYLKSGSLCFLPQSRTIKSHSIQNPKSRNQNLKH